MRRLFVLAALLFALPAHALVEIDWVTVGDPGNPADTEVMNDGTTGYGSVSYVYRIGKYEVTNAQYAEFLNAVAASDTFDLYSPGMHYQTSGGITQSGTPGSFTYSVKPGMGNKPVNYVSFWDALRFANWLQNGQPSGIQDSSTTENGAYWLTPRSIELNVALRNPGATIFLASEDEWYKAAYYDTVSTSYFDYPAGSDVPTTCAAPGAMANTANCIGSGVNTVTNVGSYTGSASPYGTFDQGGNVWEWNERKYFFDGRIDRGGGFNYRETFPGSDGLAAWARDASLPTFEHSFYGFRVAMIPEPGTGLLLAFGLAGLGVARGRRQ